MRIVSRYRSIIGKGFIFEDGNIQTLRKFTNKDGTARFEFDGSNYYIGLDSMRVVSDGIDAEITAIDQEVERLNVQIRALRQSRRCLLEKNYSKFPKVYDWTLTEHGIN